MHVCVQERGVCERGREHYERKRGNISGSVRVVSVCEVCTSRFKSVPVCGCVAACVRMCVTENTSQLLYIEWHC